MNSTIQLRADPFPAHHIQNLATFVPVTICPTESLAILLDGKRTTNPPNCWRTRLSRKSNGLSFLVDNIKILHLSLGDPVVVSDTIEEDNTRLYGIVKEIAGDLVTLHDNGQSHQFYQGAFIQNLTNRWSPEHKIEGATSQIKRPSAPTFRAKRTEHGVDVVFSVPLNPGVTKYYDVYVRNQLFNNIGAHWIPDAANITVDVDRKSITTYNGGAEAGGGTISHTALPRLACAVIAKTSAGFVNIYESDCLPQEI